MGGKHSTTTSKVTIPPEVLARYNAVNKRAETAAATPYKAFGNTASDYVAQMNAQQNAGINDINATAGSYLPYMDKATAATTAGMGPAYAGIENYMSPYIKNVADTTGAYMRQQQEQAQSGALGTAAMSGAFGGDRAGIAAANLQQQNQMGYGKTMADIMNQGYTQALGASQADLARQLQGGAQMAGLGAQSQQLGLQGAQAKIAAGTMQQQTEQAGKDAMINQFMQEKGYPFQVAQFLANIAMGTGAASGSTTTTQTPRNWLGFASGGAVEGYASGGVAGPRTYTQSGVGGEGYVPAGDLPVGQLMIAPPPEQGQNDKTGEIIKMITMAMGAARGGAIDQRHGYALDGGVSYPALNTEELRREQEIRKQLSAGTGIIGDLNKDALMRAPLNPANMGLAGHQAPQMVAPTGVAPAGAAPIVPAPPVKTGVVTPAETLTRTPAGGVGATGVADDAMMAVGKPKLSDLVSPTQTSSVIDQTPATLETKPSNWDMADTGLAPTGGYGAIVPVKTQLDFVTYELQKPEYKGYLENAYATPAQAAVAFEQIYERAKGANNDVAAANATDIYNAAQNGKLNELPPNVAIAYNHFIENGMDPIQAAGATGRLMVESYSHLDPNARNTLGGGNGTYGLAQWRGSRMEELANFAGIPLETLANAPVSTPEGRYYSHGADFSGGLNGGRQVSGDGLDGANMAQQRDGLFTNNKPYEQRNAIGKFFYDPNTGKLDKNALLSVLMGVGKAAEAQTISPLGGILSGIGGGAEAYKGLVKQQADVAATNIDNMRNIQMDTMTYNEMNGTNLTPQQYASMIGASYQIPVGIGQPIGGDKMTWNEYQNGVVQVGGRSVKMQDDPVSIQKFISDNSMFPAESPIGKQVAEARLHLNDINSSGGMTIDANGQQFQVPGYTEVGNVQAKSEADRVAAADFRKAAGDAINSSAQQLAAVKTLESVYSKMEPGKFANVGAEASAILSALDPGNVTGWGKYDLTDPAQYEIAMKGAGEIMATRLRTMPGGAPSAEIDMLSTVTPTPNMQPAAVKKLLAITKADAKYRLDMYNNYDPAVHGNDVNAYMRNFADSGKTFTRYVEEAMASMPRFAGESIEPTAAEAELIKRGYKRNSEGKLVKP
jgi:hypothetical protein